MSHELLRDPDIDSTLGEIRAEFMTEAIRNEIRCKGIRRDELVPVNPSSHFQIQLT